MIGVELHVLDYVAAVIEGGVLPPLASVRLNIGGHVLQRDRPRLEDFVLEPPTDIGILFATHEFCWEVRQHLKNEFPLPLIVGKLDVVCQGDAGNAGVDQGDRPEIATE
jgi:hypothetical protein